MAEDAKTRPAEDAWTTLVPPERTTPKWPPPGCRGGGHRRCRFSCDFDPGRGLGEEQFAAYLRSALTAPGIESESMGL